MLNSQVVTIQEKIRPVLQEAGISRAGLFGSCARGEMNEASDVDILVEPPEKFTLFSLSALQRRLENVLGRDVDVVTYRSLHHLLRDRILAEELSLSIYG